MSENESRKTSVLEFWVRVLCLSVLVTGAGLALMTWDSLVEGSMDRDWTMFYRAGELFLRGEVREIYLGSGATGYPFAYPPFTLYLVALYALVPRSYAWYAIGVFNLACVLVSVQILCRLFKASFQESLTIHIVVLASAPFLTTLVVGHLSGLLFLLFVCGMFASCNARPLAAGLIWGGLAVKPHLFIPLMFFMLPARRWRILCGMILTVVCLILITVPLGLDVWNHMVKTGVQLASSMALNPDMLWKQVTFHAFLKSVLNDLASPFTMNVLWLLTSVTLFICLSVCWWRCYSPRTWVRLLAASLLLVVSGNTYAWFYDTLFMVVPGVCWYMNRREYGSDAMYAASGVVLAVTYVWLHVGMFFMKSGPSLSGLFLAGWLVIEIVDLLPARRRAEPSSGPVCAEVC